MEELFIQIRDNLTKSYIFYLPDSLMKSFEQMSILKSIPADAFNQLGVIDSNQKISLDYKKVDFISMMNKVGILDENMYTLFQAKEDLKDIQFNFLIEKYIDFLDSHCFLTGWMYSNISSFITPVSEETINLFRMQSEFLEQHYTKVRKHFNLDPKGRELNVKSIVDHYKEKFNDAKFSVKVPSKIPNVPIKETIQTKPRAKKKKPVLITDEDADRFLLETVFHVKFRNENH